MDWQTIIAVASPVAVVVSGYTAVKVGLNGTRERVKRLESSHEQLKTDTTDRLARIETKLDTLIERK